MTKFVSWLRELRMHQWTKNLLLAIPALASFQLLQNDALTQLALAFISFNLIASGSYIFNDFLDLKSDQLHAIKRSRPLASGAISIRVALLVAIAMLLTGLYLGYVVSQYFFLTLVVYLAVTVLYSLWLKKVTLVDAILLAGLYTLRVIAGAVATEIELSFWLLTFSVFFFLSLAWVKRYAELESARSRNVPLAPGRGYLVSDMPVVLAFGTATAFLAVLVFALYLDSSAIRSFYASPEVGWLAIPFVLYLIGRMWFKAHRGQMNEDPILFVIKDAPSLLAILLAAGSLLLAHAGLEPWL